MYLFNLYEHHINTYVPMLLPFMVDSVGSQGELQCCMATPPAVSARHKYSAAWQLLLQGQLVSGTALHGNFPCNCQLVCGTMLDGKSSCSVSLCLAKCFIGVHCASLGYTVLLM